MFVYGQMGDSGAFVLGFAVGESFKKTKQSAIYKVDSEFMLISCFCGNKAQFSESGSVFKKTKTHSGQFFCHIWINIRWTGVGLPFVSKIILMWF